MPVPFTAALAMPLLTGGGAAAGGAGLAGLGSMLGGLGTAAGGLGSLFGALGGGGGSSQPDFASLYAQLAPGQTALTTQQYELGARLQPVLQAQGLLSKIYGESAWRQFTDASEKDKTAAGVLTGITSQYANSAIGAQDKANLSKIAAETLGFENAAKIANTYASAAAALKQQELTGLQTLLSPTSQALASAGQTAQQGKNQLASNIGATNLEIRKDQERTRNAMALKRADIEGQLALKRYGAGLAMAGQAQFA